MNRSIDPGILGAGDNGEPVAIAPPDAVVVGSAARDVTAADRRGWRLGGGVTYGALTLARLGLRVGAVAQFTDCGVGDSQLDRDHAISPCQQLLLLVGGRAGDRQHGAGAIDQGHRGVEDLGGRRRHGRQASA